MTGWIGCTVSKTELAQIDALVVRTGQTREDWIQSLIQMALSETPHNIRHLTERVTYLEQQQERITTLTQQVNLLTQQLQHQQLAMSAENHQIHQAVIDPIAPMGLSRSSLDSPVIPSVNESAHLNTAQVKTNSQDLEDDELDDQPDEILYDFLEPRSSLENTSSTFNTTRSSPSDLNIYDADDEPDEVLYDFLDEDERPF